MSPDVEPQLAKKYKNIPRARVGQGSSVLGRAKIDCTCIGASSMLFLSRSLGGLVRPRSPPLGSGKVGVRPNPGRYPGPWVVERPASGQTPDVTPERGGERGRTKPPRDRDRKSILDAPTEGHQHVDA